MRVVRIPNIRNTSNRHTNWMPCAITQVTTNVISGGTPGNYYDLFAITGNHALWLCITRADLVAFFGRRRKWNRIIVAEGEYEVPDSGDGSGPTPGINTFSLDGSIFGPGGIAVDVVYTALVATPDERYLPHLRSIFMDAYEPNFTPGELGVDLTFGLENNLVADVQVEEPQFSNMRVFSQDRSNADIVPRIIFSNVRNAYYVRPITHLQFTVYYGAAGRFSYNFGWASGAVPSPATTQDITILGITSTVDDTVTEAQEVAFEDSPTALFTIPGYFYWPSTLSTFIASGSFDFRCAIPASNGYFEFREAGANPVRDATDGSQNIPTPMTQ